MIVRRIFDLLEHINEQYHTKTDILAGKREGIWYSFIQKIIRNIVIILVML